MPTAGSIVFLDDFLGTLFVATSSMSMPPSVLAMMSGRDSCAVEQHGQIEFLSDLSRPAATRIVCTMRPSWPVCFVTRTWPSMLSATFTSLVHRRGEL
jgi:hypothetical protein